MQAKQIPRIKPELLMLFDIKLNSVPVNELHSLYLPDLWTKWDLKCVALNLPLYLPVSLPPVPLVLNMGVWARQHATGWFIRLIIVFLPFVMTSTAL